VPEEGEHTRIRGLDRPGLELSIVIASLQPGHTRVPIDQTRGICGTKAAQHPYSSELWHDTT